MFGKNASTGALWFLALVMVSGCAGPLEPTTAPDSQNRAFSSLAVDGAEPMSSPEVAKGGLFYPLDLGNHWEYERSFTAQVFPDHGPPLPPETFLATVDFDLIGTAQRFGREYVVQRETYREDQGEFSNDFLYRQDRGGLYNADPGPLSTARAGSSHRGHGRLTTESMADRLIASAPSLKAYRQAILRVLEQREMLHQLALAGRATQLERVRPGPLPGEIQLLQYPLHTHRTWHVREDPLFIYTVEGQEVLDLPAGRFNGWRIRIESELFGSDTRAHVWYGRDGQLKLAAHYEEFATDKAGNLIGRFVADEVQALSDLDLDKPGRKKELAFDSYRSAP